MMRDLITAFSTDTRDRMTSGGWRKRPGDIYTRDLGDGFHAWVGLNRASKHHPLKINPVVGLRYDPLERLLADIAGAASLTSATIARPVGHLTPGNSLLQLRVAEPGDVERATDELCELVQAYGLPFARQHASTDALLTALRAGGNVPNPDRTEFSSQPFTSCAGTRTRPAQTSHTDSPTTGRTRACRSSPSTTGSPTP
ncbi:hypothetical protein ACIPJE_29315 [Streptomyces albidoflavus]